MYFEIIFEKKNLNVFNFKLNKWIVEIFFKVYVGSILIYFLEK